MRAPIALLVLAFAAHFGAAALAQDATLTILSPQADSYLSDRARIEVRLVPPPRAGDGTSYTFYADGKEVCRLTAPTPPACEWDAGAAVRAHLIRVVASLGDGRRVIATVRTHALDVAESTSVRVVRVTAVVTDRSGSFVRGLPREAFQLAEDGVTQSIDQFSGDNAPLQIVLALDISASMERALPELQSAAAGFVALLPTSAALSMVAFNNETFTILHFDDPVERRPEAITRLSASGGTALNDAIIRCLDDLSGESGRRALVVFTDGEDRSSRATEAQVRNAVESSDATVYFVALGRGREVDALTASMDRLAVLSGGRALQAENPGRLAARFREVIEELSHQYLLGYDPTNARLDGQWRRIDVRLSGEGLRVRARPGYRAPTALK